MGQTGRSLRRDPSLNTGDGDSRADTGAAVPSPGSRFPLPDPLSPLDMTILQFLFPRKTLLWEHTGKLREQKMR
jgi:hypothetical protein